MSNNTHKLFAQVQNFVQAEIFPNCADYKLELQGSIFYGSRVCGFSRKNSDIDALFVITGVPVDKETNWCMEYHGSVTIAESIMLSELRFYTNTSLKNALEDYPLVRLNVISTGQIFCDSQGFLKNAKQVAQQRIDVEVENLIQELKEFDVATIINMMKIHFYEAQNVLIDSFYLENRFCANARLMEYIIDFYIYGHRLVFAKQLQQFNSPLFEFEQKVDKNILKNLLLLEGYRGARVLDFRKFTLDADFQRITMSISEIIKQQNCPWEYQIKQIFALFDTFFQDHFNTSLFLQPEELCQQLLIN